MKNEVNFPWHVMVKGRERCGKMICFVICLTFLLHELRNIEENEFWTFIAFIKSFMSKESSESENRKWMMEINWFFRRIILAHLIEAMADPHVIHLEALAEKPTASQTTSFCDSLQILSVHVQRARWEICLLSKHHVVVESLSVGRTQLGINRDDSRIYFLWIIKCVSAAGRNWKMMEKFVRRHQDEAFFTSTQTS